MNLQPCSTPYPNIFTFPNLQILTETFISHISQFLLFLRTSPFHIRASSPLLPLLCTHLPYRTSTNLNIRVPSQAWRSYHTSPVSRFLSYNILLCTNSWCSLYRCLFARRESSPPLCFPCHPVITRSRSPTSTGCLRLDATTSHLTSLARCDGCRKCMPVVSC